MEPQMMHEHNAFDRNIGRNPPLSVNMCPADRHTGVYCFSPGTSGTRPEQTTPAVMGMRRRRSFIKQLSPGKCFVVQAFGSDHTIAVGWTGCVFYDASTTVLLMQFCMVGRPSTSDICCRLTATGAATWHGGRG
jgi:hypothetical protein